MHNETTPMKWLLAALFMLMFVPAAFAGTPKLHNTSTTISCTPNPVALNAATTCTITVTDLGGQGPDTPPAGTVSVSSNGTGSFSASSCNLVVSAAAASSCSVTYTPTVFGSGTHTVTATYGGGSDPNPSTGIVFNGSSGNTPVALTYPALTITSIAPAFGERGTAVNVTVTGTNFIAGATALAIGGAGVAVSGITVTSGTQLTATLTIAVAAATGLRNVTVTNPAPGGGSATLVNGFEVRNPLPAVTSLSPAAVEEGSGAIVLTINGSGFIPESVAWFNGSAYGTTFVNSGELQISLSAGDTATVGDYPVHVVNATPGGGTSNTVQFSVLTSGGSFDTVEANAALGSTMYTKIAGVGFSFDILATEISRLAIDTGFVGTVKLELLDASDDSAGLDASGCRASWSVAQALPDQVFSASDNGRIAINASHAGALRVARFRVSYPATGTPTHVGCSADAFSIRPASLSVTTPLTNAGDTGAPIHAAGVAFTMTASAVAGYDGTPQVDAALLSAHAGANATGVLAGAFPAATIISGSSAGNAFTYSEVGNFALAAEGVYDSSFTAVDQPGDCTADFSNTLAGGRYGCSFGTTAVLDVGRFVPAYFDVEVTDGCADAGGFTYSRQPFTTVVTAREAGGSVTENYAGGHARDVTLSDGGDASAFVAGTNVIPAIDFTLGVAGIATNPDTAYEFANPETPYTFITLRAENADGASSLGHLEESTEIRSGRLVIGDGSAITSDDGLLMVALQAWRDPVAGVYEWAVHVDDTTCTSLAAGNFTLSGALAAQTSISGFFFNAGQGALTLAAPGAGNEGTVDVDVTTDDWLHFDWDSDSTPEAPHGTMTFFEVFDTEPGFIDRYEVIP